MKTFKQILRSTFSNETTITGARHRKWYISIVLLFISLIFSVVPTFSMLMSTKGDEELSSYSYGLSPVTYTFFEEMSKNSVSMKVAEDPNGEHFLSVMGFNDYSHEHNGNVDFKAYYVDTASYEQREVMLDSNKYSVMIFTQKEFFLNVVNPSNPGTPVKVLVCEDAYKKFSTGYNIVSEVFKENNEAETFENAREFMRLAHKTTRNKEGWAQTLVSIIINFAVILLMDFMVWILTRGKQNVFRPWNFWDSSKITMWASLSPAILTIPFGFLFKRFAAVMFPMLVGVRVMWLTMKQLRPDGSGYIDPEE